MIKHVLRWIIRGIICWGVVILTTYGWRPLFTKGMAEHDPQVVANLRSTVQVLSEQIGDRNYKSIENLNKAKDFIRAALLDLGYTIEEQQYTINGQAFTNVIAYAGDAMPQESVIVGAHYDTCFNPGADDNASGVAGMLELARQFKGAVLKTPVVFVAFTNEEPPFFSTTYMGSHVFVQQLKKQGKTVKAAVILEMIGVYSQALGSQRYLPLIGIAYPNQGNFIAVVGNFPSRKLTKDLTEGMRKGSNFPVESVVAPGSLPGIHFSDHRSFWEEGYPAVMVTDTAYLRYPHYHHDSDTIEKLDFTKMGRMLKGLKESIAVLADKR